MNFIYCEPQADERRFDLKVSTQRACKKSSSCGKRTDSQTLQPAPKRKSWEI